MLNIMKSRFSGRKIIFFLALFCSLPFAQGWNNTVTTSISSSDLSGIDLFTNRNGNNIVTSHFSFPPISRWVKYYLLNSSGSVIRSSTIEAPTQNLSGLPVKVSGDNNTIYAVFLINSVIRAKKSTDAGVSWTTHDLTSPAGSGVFDGIDIIFDNITNKLHIVYSRGTAGYPDHLTHYYALRSDNTWGEYKQVSDYGSYYTPPTVSFSQDRVHISYEEGGVAKSRDKYLSEWQTAETVASPFVEHKIHAHSSKLLYFYGEPQQGYFDIYVRQRDFNGTWSSPFLLREIDGFVPAAANTFDSKTHIVYYGGLGNIYYRNYNGSIWSPDSIIGTGGPRLPIISSVSNDLFVIWENTTLNYLIYKQYDAAPLAPQNPQLSTNPSNNRVRLSWSKNQEPDISIYEVWRKVAEMGGNWQLIGTTTNNYFVDNEYYYAPKAGDFTLTYKVRAKDIGNNFSLYSNEVTVRAEYLGKEYLAGNNTDYKLIQNYPNPFNPSTKISYSIKDDGFVTLKVYDILGIEIATLVNEQKTAGSYEADFNAANLPSGMYIYKLHAGSFTDVKKMLLTK